MSSLSYVLRLYISVVLIFIFLMFKCSPALALSFFTFIRISKLSQLSASNMLPSAYIIDISSTSFHFSFLWVLPSILYMFYIQIKQVDKMHPYLPPLPIGNRSVFPYPVLTVASCPQLSAEARPLLSGQSIAFPDPYSWRFYCCL